jgi:hypothetical protein
VTRLPSETPGGGNLRDAYGRRELTVRGLNDPLDQSDVQGAGGVFDADGREHVVATGRSGTVLVAEQVTVLSAADAPYSVRFDGTDETAKLQAWINAAAALGRVAWLPPGTARFTTLTYPAVANGLNIRASGRRISVLDQIAGTAAPLLAPASVASSSVGLVIEDLGLTAFNNQAANTGGVVLQATAKSDLRRCRISWTRDFHVKIIGGQSAQGDTMYNTLERNVLENPATTTHYAVWIAPGPDVPAAAKGSHPDGTRILNNHVQSATNTVGHVGVKVDAPATDAAGYLGADSVLVGDNNFQEVHRPVQMASQRSTVRDNRAECTTGTMDVVVDAGTATGFPSLGNRFVDNNWLTHGDPDSFTFTDNGFGTTRLNDTPKGSQEAGATNSPRDTPAFEVVRDSTSFGEFYLRGRHRGEAFSRIQFGADGSLWMNLGAADPTVKGARMYPIDVGSGQAGFRVAAILNFIGGGATSRVVSGFASGEAADRWHIRANGSFERGLGTATPALVDAIGAGSPEGVVTGAVGSVYHRTDGGANTSLYVKESGTGNTGWVAK